MTIRTLGAGAGKPVPGLGESNPIIGMRGVRVSLAHRDVFRTQLRALATAAAELAEVRKLLAEEVDSLRIAGIDAAFSKLAMMVEVPAAALMVETFSRVGNYVTSLELAGCSATPSLMVDEVLSLWDALVHIAAFRWGR